MSVYQFKDPAGIVGKECREKCEKKETYVFLSYTRSECDKGLMIEMVIIMIITRYC